MKDWRARTSGPSHYKPSIPGTGRQLTADELAAGSSVLKQEAARHRPPPPPRRGDPPSNRSSPSASPALPATRTFAGRSPSISQVDPPSPEIRQTPAPPYSHAAAHDYPAPSSPIAAASASGKKKFSQYTKQDKEDFFSALDHFFSTRLNLARTSTGNSAALRSPSPPPPPISQTNRPTLLGPTGTYPPIQTHSSSALSLLHSIFSTPTTPTSAWFCSQNPVPPFLTGRTDIRSTGSWSQQGDSKSLLGCVLFGDCSMAWYKITWSARDEMGGRLTESTVKKDGVYRPIPASWDGERLYNASEMYSGRMLEFADSAVRGGRAVGRGECWDIANEALKVFEGPSGGGVPKPFPSIGRTHGHLVFYADAKRKDQGLWRGGDQYVRPGDVVEWNQVKIREVGMMPGAYAILGKPEHTAVITSVDTPTALPTEGAPYPLSSLVSFTVVEQSQGVVPSEKTYDLASMSEGQVWIYRPVPLVEYVGSELDPTFPPRCQAWRVGELE
ncbi:hypothetical protein T439DRAFT_326835 [Meredithblackwellia eburnea MCA 4105]